MDPILVVGAGPVGLSLALGLIRAGDRVIVVDARPGIPDDPRATTLQPPVLAAYEGWGILPTLMERGTVVTMLQYWDWSAKRLLAELDLGELLEHTPTPFRVHLDQAGICQVLLEAIEEAAPGTVRWGHKATSMAMHDDHVQLVTTTRDGHAAVHRGRWICGADGGHSWVRAQLGISFDGPDEEQSFLTARFDRGAFRRLGELAGERLAGVSYLFLEDEWAMVMDMPDHVRVLFHTGGNSAQQLDRAATKARAFALLGTDEHHLKTLGHYHVRLRLAGQFAKGRAVLLGDAAHAGYPVGGTAMNAGILDAEVLVDALAKDDPWDVGVYAETRREWNRRHLLGETAKEVRELEAHWPWTRWFRAQAIRSIDDSHASRLGHLLELSLLGNRVV